MQQWFSNIDYQTSQAKHSKFAEDLFQVFSWVQTSAWYELTTLG